MAYYVNATELAKAISKSKREKKLTPELIAFAGKIFYGRMGSFTLTTTPSQREDAIQEAWLMFLKNWKKLNSKKNCFSYITQIGTIAMLRVLRSDSRNHREFSNTLDTLQA